MKNLIFGGSSDDTFGEITPGGDDYDNCASGKPIEWLIESAETGEAMLVVGQYGATTNSGGWLVGVSPWDPTGDGVPLPNWPITIGRSDLPYSPALMVQVPDDATIRCLQRGEED